MMNRVLIFADRPQSAEDLASQLDLFGFQTSVTRARPAAVMRSLRAHRPSVIVIDSSTGTRELFYVLHNATRVPILVLANSRSDADLISFLEEGAAGYVSRPVSAAALAAHLRSALRRADKPVRPSLIELGDLELDLDRHQLRRNGETIPLTSTEARLLRALAEYQGRPCSHSFLLERVWGSDFVDCGHYLRIYIGRLRQKLEEDPKVPRFITTAWGLGYCLADPNAGVRNTAKPVALQPRTA